MIRIINCGLFILFLPFLPLHWMLCRLFAKQCPNCKAKWWTELVGEWDGEMWTCHYCDHYWEVK